MYELKNPHNYLLDKWKMDLFEQQYPNIKYHILVCDSDDWKLITKEYSKDIPNWEQR